MKKRVLIVEDDKFFRFAVKKMIKWEEYGMTLAGEAVHGAAALEFLKENPVEIVLTDMNMPVMDGIAFTKAVKEQYPRIMVIALSAYDDFEFVRQSMKLGASDYLLKQDMEEEDVGRTILDMWEKYMRSLSLDNRIRDGILEFLRGRRCPIEEEVREYLKFCLDETCGWYVCAVRNLKKEWENPECGQAYWLKESILEVPDRNEHLIFFGSKKTAAENVRLEARNEMLARIERITGQETSAAALSAWIKDVDELAGLQESLEEVMECGRFFRKGKILAKEEAELRTRNLSWVWEPDTEQELSDMVRQCRRNMPDEEHLQRSFLIFLDQASSKQSFHVGNLEFAELAGALSRIFFLEDKEKFMEEYIAEQIARKGVCGCHPGVQQCIDYMEKEYSQPLTLKLLAGRVAMNETYLSNLFKRETGTGVVDYLNQIRIREAKKLLLTTNDKNYEVGEKVGIPNASYFSTIFKKETGITIQEFRRSSAKK